MGKGRKPFATAGRQLGADTSRVKREEIDD